MNSKRRLAVGAALAGLMIAIAGCGSGGSSGDASSSSLTVASQADVSSLDPILGNSGFDHMMLYPVYDTLIAADKNFQPAPDLATSWKWVKPTQLQLTLRSGVKFQDGTPFNADAVKFNLTRAMGPDSLAKSDLTSLKSVTVKNPRTVELNLSRPDSSLLMVLSDRAGMMVSPTAAKAGKLATHPVGAGGWTFVSWNRGASLEYKRYDGYWNSSAVRAANLTFRVIPDSKTRLTALQSGQVDIANELAPSDADTVKNNSQLKLEESNRFQFLVMYLFRDSGPFANADVRRAVNLAIDRDAIAKYAYFGHADPANSVLPAHYWAAPPSDVSYSHDPSEARKLLSAAGQSNLKFNAIVANDTQSVRVAEIMKQELGDAGITMNLIPEEVVQSTAQFFDNHQAPALITSWTGRPDPAMTYRSLLTAAGSYNASKQSVPGVDELLAKSDNETDVKRRGQIFQQLAQTVYKQSALMPVVFPDALVGLSNKVSGFQPNLLGKPKFIGVTVGN